MFWNESNAASLVVTRVNTSADGKNLDRREHLIGAPVPGNTSWVCDDKGGTGGYGPVRERRVSNSTRGSRFEGLSNCHSALYNYRGRNTALQTVAGRFLVNNRKLRPPYVRAAAARVEFRRVFRRNRARLCFP
jgi:hypothetical protein